jgi:hypothetical protein
MIEQPATPAERARSRKVEERRQDETVSVDFPAPEETDAT